jgi:hypothetical protein
MVKHTCWLIAKVIGLFQMKRPYNQHNINFVDVIISHTCYELVFIDINIYNNNQMLIHQPWKNQIFNIESNHKDDVFDEIKHKWITSACNLELKFYFGWNIAFNFNFTFVLELNIQWLCMLQAIDKKIKVSSSTQFRYQQGTYCK